MSDINTSSESHLRSLAKAFSWRILATLTTSVIAFFVNQNVQESTYIENLLVDQMILGMEEWLNLGVSVDEGSIRFKPVLLSQEEFLKVSSEWILPGQKIMLKPGQLGFTLCGIPVVYTMGQEEMVFVNYTDGKRAPFPGTSLPEDLSNLVFNRSDTISMIEVGLKEGA